jgi:FkbH-like protein
MKLNEALKASARARGLPVRQRAFLACGFEPVHLPVFVQAFFGERFPDEALGVEHGVYGDLLGNIERARLSESTVALVLIELGDVHPRLGLRSSGAWTAPPRSELLGEVEQRLARLRAAIEKLAERMPVILATPGVPFVLLGHTTGWQASALELELELAITRFAADVARCENVRVLHPARLAALSLAAGRSDPRSELATGFPFSLPHASALGQCLVELAYPVAPKKGLITDLDDTLWSGIVGEVGHEAVSWTQARHSQLHGLYQSLLRQLSEAGVLLAVASKNEPEVVELALARADLLIDRQAFFPVAASWGPKSEAVGAILRAWNIGADSVVVVDDSPMELEEIRRAHPGITCLELHPRDPQKTLQLLSELRDLFGKPVTREEDRLRLSSLRNAARFEQLKEGTDLGAFLRELQGTVTFDARRAGSDGRLPELINKTNQFSMNGSRVTEGEWMRYLRDDDRVAVGVGYADRYGALGTIAVVAGRWLPPGDGPGGGRVLDVEHWVLSCRAFSRRIEEHTLALLFELFGCDGLRLNYRATARNKPFQEFLARLGEAQSPDRAIDLRRRDLESVLGDLPHQQVITRE